MRIDLDQYVVYMGFHFGFVDLVYVFPTPGILSKELILPSTSSQSIPSTDNSSPYRPPALRISLHRLVNAALECYPFVAVSWRGKAYHRRGRAQEAESRYSRHPLQRHPQFQPRGLRSCRTALMNETDKYPGFKWTA